MNNVAQPILPTPPAIVQQERSWIQIVTEIAQIASQEDQHALEMGDRFVEIERRFDRRRLKAAAEQAGVSWSLARQRHWTSSKIPPDSALRQLPLTFTHLRVLAGVEDGALQETLAQQAVENAWSAAQLISAVENRGVQRRAEEGQSCIQCEQAVNEEGPVISFKIHGGARAQLCGPQCAVNYFTELAEQPAPEAEELDFFAV